MRLWALKVGRLFLEYLGVGIACMALALVIASVWR